MIGKRRQTKNTKWREKKNIKKRLRKKNKVKLPKERYQDTSATNTDPPL